MPRRLMWIPLAALLAVAAVAQPWRSETAEARPARAAACKDDVTRLRAELAASQAALATAQADLAKARSELARILAAEKRRADRLADQLGSPMIETLKGTENLK